MKTHNVDMMPLFRVLAFVCVVSSCAASAHASGCKLNGQYAFLFEGNQNLIAVGRVGEFTVTSTGKVTGGVQDVNGPSGPSNSTITSGTCTNGTNGLGTLILVSGGVPITYKFVVTKAGNARMIEFDDSTGLGVRGSGFIRKQDKTAFSLAKLSGDWAFSFSGSSIQGGTSSGNRYGVIGRLTTNRKGAVSGSVLYESENQGGFYYFSETTSLTAPSSITAPNTATGRGTATETYDIFGLATTSHYAFYVLTADEILFLNTDSVATNKTAPLVLGQQLRQQGAGTFSNASSRGGMVFSLTGWDPFCTDYGGSDVLVGEFSADGRGNLSGHFDENDAACSPSYASPDTGSYSINSDGSGTLSFCCTYSGTRVFSIVMIQQSTVFLLEAAGPSGEVGQMEPQSAGVLTVQGTYNSGSDVQPIAGDYTNFGVGDVTNAVGKETFTNTPNGPFLTGAQDLSEDSSPFLESISFNGYDNLQYLVPGEVVLSSEESGYIISPAKFVTINTFGTFGSAVLVRYEQ
jgi:hypothetical protein